jgi:hypothetical protein
MNEANQKIDENSTASTNDNSPQKENNIRDPLFDERIKEFEQKNQKLGELLLTTKRLLDKRNNEYETKVKELEASKQEYNEIYALYQNYINDDSKHKIDMAKATKVTARVKLDAVIWTCIRFEDKIEWYREESIFSSGAENKEKYNRLNPAEVFDPVEKENFEKVKKEMKNTQEELIKQYETRVQKMQAQWESSEKKNLELRELAKSLSKSNDSRSNEFSKLITSLVDESTEIRERSLLYLNSDSDENTKNEAMNKMKFLLNNLQKISFQHDLAILNDLKTHILLLHQTLYDSLKQLGNAQAEIIQLDKAWKKSFDTLVGDLEKEKKDKQEVIEMGRKKIKDLEGQIEYIKLETAKYLREKDLKIEFLNKELKKNANTEYIRNIVYSFMTNQDLTVREKLIPVIATVLQFPQNDLDNAKVVWDRERKSILTKSTQWINDKLKKNPAEH